MNSLRKFFVLTFLVWIFSLPVNLFANEPLPGTAPWLLESYLNKTPIKAFPASIDLEEAKGIQEEFVKLAGAYLGLPVGYKAGLTNPSTQKRFGLTHPIRGILLKKMLLQNGAEVEANFGAVPMCEGDLMVRVGNSNINNAKTLRDVLAGLDAVIPFIELPDLLFGKDLALSAPMIVAANVGARLGVLGEPIAITPTKEWEERFLEMSIEIFDQNGRKLTEGKGESLLGNPLKVVLWLRDSLKAEGKSLKKGDLLSLGTLAKMIPVKSGLAIKAIYKRLDPRGPVAVYLKFK